MRGIKKHILGFQGATKRNGKLTMEGSEWKTLKLFMFQLCLRKADETREVDWGNCLLIAHWIDKVKLVGKEFGEFSSFDILINRFWLQSFPIHVFHCLLRWRICVITTWLIPLSQCSWERWLSVAFRLLLQRNDN